MSVESSRVQMTSPALPVCLIALWVAMLSPGAVLAQDDGSKPGPTRVGVMAAPPFMMQTASGRWEGLSIELWRELAHVLDLDFEWREYASLAEVRGAAAPRITAPDQIVDDEDIGR